MKDAWGTLTVTFSESGTSPISLPPLSFQPIPTGSELGSVGAIKFRIEAEKYRAEAARLRDVLAQIESQNQSTAGVPAP